MNQNTLKNVIIGLLAVIILLLVLLYIYQSKNASTPSSTTISATKASYPTIVGNMPPVILDSPYLYDSGYWVSPDSWWMGPDAGNYYVRNHYKTNNYYYDKQSNSNKPVPTTTMIKPTTTTASPTAAITIPGATLPTTTASMGMAIPTPSMIMDILPTGQLIAPSQDSVFPLPTLATPGMMIPPDAMNGNITQPQLSDLSMQNTVPTMMADSMAAAVDMQASQVIGMRGGNNLDSAISVPEITPSITQLH